MNNYCKKCRLRDGCLQKCKEAEVYEQGYNDAVKEFKKTKKTTMEKELKIEVPQGYEIDRQKSTFEKIVFKKIKHCKPTTWKEYCKYAKDCPSYYGNPRKNNIFETRFDGFYNEFFTEERAKQYVSFGKLLQLRDYWVKGYDKFSYIVWSDNCSMVYVCYWDGITPYPLTFPTKEMAEEFKDCFEDLIKQAYPLV